MAGVREGGGVAVWAGCGEESSLVLRADGSLLACGSNRCGHLGLPPAIAAVAAPVAIPGLPALRAAVAGPGHVVGVESGPGPDGADRLWGWGRNDRGQLGPARRLGMRRGEDVVWGARRLRAVDGRVVSVRLCSHGTIVVRQ